MKPGGAFDRGVTGMLKCMLLNGVAWKRTKALSGIDGNGWASGDARQISDAGSKCLTCSIKYLYVHNRFNRAEIKIILN